MTDLLNDTQREITDRLKDLKPVVDEFNRLEAAVTALDGIPAVQGGTGATRGARGSRRQRGSETTATSVSTPPAAGPKGAAEKPAVTRRGRGGRRKGSGKRAAQTLGHIQEQPGVTTTELATKTGTNQSYLYRVLRVLEQTGKIRKDGRGWHPRES